MVVPTFHSTITVSSAVFNVGADPESVFHSTDSELHVMV
jgi:hypothetical protein